MITPAQRDTLIQLNAAANRFTYSDRREYQCIGQLEGDEELVGIVWELIPNTTFKRVYGNFSIDKAGKCVVYINH